MSLPEATRRLFPHTRVEELSPELFAAIVERLLEDGDRADLRWLTSEVEEARIAEWFEERGDRQLSDRSRAFWGVVLDRPAPARRARGEELWLL